MNNHSNNKRNIHLDKSKLFEQIGILDPEGKNPNPLTNQPYNNLYLVDPDAPMKKNNATYQWYSSNTDGSPKGWINLPMYKIKDESIKILYENNVVLVISGTGSGKTVLTPKFLLHALNYQARIAITNPKRIPTRNNAEYAAKCLDVELGKEVGMKFKGSDSKHYSPSDSRLIYTTDGYIRARLQNDPLLLDFDAVIIDEAHERNVQIDMLLLQLKDLLKVRAEFKLIIMSATVNAKMFINYFPIPEFKFAMIDAGEIPFYPIQEYFLEKSINKFDSNDNLINDAYIDAAVDRIIKILDTTDKGAILVFFAGKGECQDGCVKLHARLQSINKNRNEKLYCDILHSGVTDEETVHFITNANRYKQNGKYTRKVVFGTEVVESSVSIGELEYVIDSGLKNFNIFYSEKNQEALEKKYISKAAHTQRKGRVGRFGPGNCYNLFTKEEYNKFLDFPKPPILTDDISENLLFFISTPTCVSEIKFPFKYDHTGGDINQLAIEELNKNKKKSKLALTQSKKKKHMELSSISGEMLKGLPLNVYLQKLITPPDEDNVKRLLDRLIALGCISIENGIGKVTDMGRAIAAFDMKPEIGRTLIASYNYHCRDEVVNLMAILSSEVAENKIDNIFMKFKPSSKDETIKKSEKAKYDKVKKKWRNAMGDQFSLIDIYNEFSDRAYDTIDRRSGRIIKEKKTKEQVREWCKENYLSYNKLEKVKTVAKDLNRKFGKVIGIFREKHPDEKPTHLFIDSPPTISEKKEENILASLIHGYYINLIKKTGERRFTDCFPPKKVSAGLSMDSFFAGVKAQYKYAIYTELKSIFGRESYSVIAKVPPAYVEKIMNSKAGKFVEDCFKKMEQEETRKVFKRKDKKRERSHSRRRSKRRY